MLLIYHKPPGGGHVPLKILSIENGDVSSHSMACISVTVIPLHAMYVSRSHPITRHACQ
jgi:hypothetical protein